ncbi:MAG TPA: hypothetical protein VLH10_17965, partial [Yinghuangia sp.]|nr:hypothetical protein [Yinghuangia sp.]
MSSTLPRRVVQAALLVAAGAAPVVGAASAHAAALPLGNHPLDLPGVSQTNMSGVPFTVDGVTDAVQPAVGVPLAGAVDKVTEPGAVPRALNTVTEAADVAETGAVPLLDRVSPQVPDLREAPVVKAVGKVQHLAAQPGVTKLVQPLVGQVAHPEAGLPSVDGVTAGSDAVARRLQASVLRPAGMGLGPALPITGYATDKSVNAAMPTMDTELARGT